MWPRAEPGWALLLTGLAGWLWGSFLNQLIDRTPRRAGPPTVPAAARAGAPAAGRDVPPGVGLLRPARSLCFGCGRTIPWYDNIPLLSYLLLRGRCRLCGAPIGQRTAWLELAAPVVLVAWHALWLRTDWPPLVLAWGLAALSWTLVAAGLLAERRRWRPGFLALGVALGGALAALVAWEALRLHW
jgi:leader peptidase (prepilin peptidase)/N-methyltransferase